MKNILVLKSSAGGAGSVSDLLVGDAVAQLKRRYPAAKVVERDLGQKPIPHLTAQTLAGVRGTPKSSAERQTRKLSEQLLAELRAADVIVIGAPMYNFSIPTGLKSWFDHVARAGETFSYSEQGPKGLLQGKSAIVIESRGGLYSEGPAKAIDFQEPYLKHMLGFMGVTDVAFIRAEKIGFGAEARSDAIENAKIAIADALSPASEALAA